MRIIHADLLVHPICPRPLGCHSTRGHIASVRFRDVSEGKPDPYPGERKF